MKKGDFRVRMPVEFTGTQGKIADTLNDIVELSKRATSEVEQIANAVGKEGKKDLTDAVNSMAANLTSQVRNIAETAVVR